MEIPEDREKLKKRLSVLSGGAARLSDLESKVSRAKHKAVLIAKKPRTVYDRLRAIAAKGRKKISKALNRGKKKKKDGQKPGLKKNNSLKRHRLP